MKNKVRRFGKGGETDDSPDFSRLTFKEAFQAARGGPNVKTPDNKTFTWNGKKYSTGLDSGKKAAAKASGPDESSAETGRLIRAAASRPSASQGALDESHPEAILPFGRIAKGIAMAAAASRPPKVTPKRTEGSMENTSRMDVEEAAAQGAKRDPKNMEESSFADEGNPNFKRGGKVKKMASGGSARASSMGKVKTSKPTMRSASSRADGIAIRGKTRA